MRTEQERKTAIDRLIINKERCNQFNFFGQDNHVAIDIMIDVIKKNRTEDFIYAQYQSSFPDDTEDFIGHGKWISAMSALDYLRGELELEGLLYPKKNTI